MVLDGEIAATRKCPAVAILRALKGGGAVGIRLTGAICRWAWKGSLFRHFWQDMTDNLPIVGGSLPRSPSIPLRGKNRATNKGRST
jgi:hypothetical protein